VLLKRATTVELDWDVRQKSRFAATDSAGRELGVFLPRGTLVRGGDVLVAARRLAGARARRAPAGAAHHRLHRPHGTAFDLI
jgi:urease accessory protein